MAVFVKGTPQRDMKKILFCSLQALTLKPSSAKTLESIAVLCVDCFDKF